MQCGGTEGNKKVSSFSNRRMFDDEKQERESRANQRFYRPGTSPDFGPGVRKSRGRHTRVAFVGGGSEKNEAIWRAT